MRDEDREEWFKVKRIFLANCKETSCHYCNIPITQKNMSVDHKHPIAKGGGVFDLKNLALCCKPCNRFKSDYDYDYFVANRTKIIADFKQRQKEFFARKAENDKFKSLKKSKDLSACFSDEEFFVESENEISIKKYRSNKVSLVRIKDQSIEFNFAETFPSEKESLLKEKVKLIVSSYGNPIKAMKLYVDFDLTYVIFEAGFLVKVSLENGEETLISNKQLSQLTR